MIPDAKEVKGWIKANKLWLTSNKMLRDSTNWKDRLQYQTIETYVINLERYLRTEVWFDHRAGENREKIVHPVCHVPAYNEDGTVKRNIGTWYKDTGVWTVEMAKAQRTYYDDNE